MIYDVDKEWDRIDYEVRIANIAYNIKVIRALWKLHYGGYGEKNIAQNENNPRNLYGSLERSQETLRQMELQQNDLKANSLFKWAQRIEKKTGIPGEYLTGQEMIDLSSVGGTGRQHYEVFFEEFSHLDDLIEELKAHENSDVMNKKIKETDISEVKKMNLREMESYVREHSKVLSKQMGDIASDAMQSIGVIKEYNAALDSCLSKLLTEDFEIRLSNNEKLYNLVHYIYRGKISGTGDTVAQLIKILNKKRTKELKDAGEELLYDYIMALREQLKLAEAVYIVASDCNDFKNKKNLKNILK